MKTKDRNCKKAKIWRQKVLKKGNYKCNKCEKRSSLVAHHIIEWAVNKDLRFEVSNGEVLCRSCHMKHHKNRKGKKCKPGWEPWIKGKKGLIVGAWKGKKFTKEHRRKLSEAKKDYKPWNVGIPMKESTKAIQSERYKGKTWKLDTLTGKRGWITK